MGDAVPISKELFSGNGELSLKTNLHVWVLYSSQEFNSHIVNEIERCKNIVCEELALSLISQESLTPLHVPDVIFVEAKGAWANKISELTTYSLPVTNSEAALIVFGNDTDTSALRIALRLGASDFLSLDSTISTLMPVFRNIVEEKIASKGLGELLLVLNTKGGNGASTIAMNMAIGLADKFPEEVLLLDLDTQFGLIPEYLDLSPKYGLLDVLDIINDLDDTALNSMVTKYGENLHTLSFVRGQITTNEILTENIQKLVPLLRQYYKYVIIDFSRGVEHDFSSLVTPATKVFLIIQQNYMSLKNASYMAKNLKFEFGLSDGVVDIVVNRYESSQQISLKDVEKTLPSVPVHLIPNDFKVANESANLGKPIVHFKKKSLISKGIFKLCDSLSPDDEKSKSWLSKLFS